MGAPLDQSHPEVVAEMRRLAKRGKGRAQIIAAIKEKFNYATTFDTVNRWVDVDFDYSGSGIPLTSEKIEEIQNLMSGDDPPNIKEAAKILGVGERSISEHKSSKPNKPREYWIEKYPDLADRLSSSDQAVVATALDTASHRERAEITRKIDEAAVNSRLGDADFIPLTDAEAEEYARKKAYHIVKGQKQRALLYRISQESDPKSFLSYPEYRKLQKSGNAPKILGRYYQGDFSKAGEAAMRQIVYDKVLSYLKSGGNPETIDMHLGHIIAMKGVESGTKKRFVSGLTNPFNVEMQPIDVNKQQSNKVTKELLRRLGYHAPGFMGLVFAGLAAPWGEAKAEPWIRFAAEASTGLDPDRAIANPQSLAPSNIGATLLRDNLNALLPVLRTDDIPQEPYYGMGRQRGLLEGHAGIGEEEQKRRTNIWT